MAQHYGHVGQKGGLLPWPAEIALDCVHWGTGEIVRWPFPQKDWLYNLTILRAIRNYQKAVRTFSKDAREWNPDDNDLFVEIVNRYGQ